MKLISFLLAFSLSNAGGEVFEYGAKAKILILSPLSIPSHNILLETLAETLIERGHQVTLISTITSTSTSRKANANANPHENFTILTPIPLEEFLDGFPNPLSISGLGSSWPFSHIIANCHKVYKNPDFLTTMQQQFDLIIVNGFMNECFYGFLFLARSPFIILTSFPIPNYLGEPLGNFLPPSVVPSPISQYSDTMNFFQRVGNFGTFVLGRIFVQWKMLPGYEAIYREYLGKDLPNVNDILKNASLVLENTHFATNFARPMSNNVVDIGGLHCRPGKNLPDVQLGAFVNGAPKGVGVIYFSLGSLLKSEDLPEHVFIAFLKVFSKLGQRVVWKLEISEAERALGRLRMPNNVMTLGWVPQQDLLAHENTRLFISHGGLLSVQEAVYHGVPMLGIPLGLDQNQNVRKLEVFGSGKVLNLNDISERTLEEAIREMLALELKPDVDSPFAKRAKVQSKIFRDREKAPVEKAAYWVEYVIRHDGARHLRNGARELNYLQYSSLDVIMFYLAVICLILMLAVMTLYFYIGRIIQRRNKPMQKQKFS